MKTAHSPGLKVTPIMIAALRGLAEGIPLSYGGRCHGKTISALIRRGLAEDVHTITEAGLAAIAKAEGGQDE